jgi:hypothetical protein
VFVRWFPHKGWVPHCPDFLRRLVALIHSMRLSLMKGAHADLSSRAWQEIGVKPFFGLSGIPPMLTLNQALPAPTDDPDSFHNFSQFQSPDVTWLGNGNPS